MTGKNTVDGSSTTLKEITDEDLSGPIVDRRTTIKLLGGVGLAGLSGLAGCSGTTDEGGQPSPTAEGGQVSKDGGRMQAGWTLGQVENLDPTFSVSGTEHPIFTNIHSGLVKTTPELEVVGDLATDWTVENKTSYTFELREGVKFHDGTEYTAEDNKFAITRIFETGAPSYRIDPLKPPGDGGIVVIDDYTLQLNFEQPYANALKAFAVGDAMPGVPISKEALDEMGKKQHKLTPVGTGPFKVDEHESGSHIILKGFDEYFETDDDGNQLPYLDEVEIKFIPEPASLVSALRGGDIEFANRLPVQNLKTLKQTDNVNVTLSGKAGGWLGLVLNGDRELFKSQKTRLAIAKTIDAEAFVQDAYFGNHHVAEGPIAPVHGWAFREEKPDDQAYAPDEAEQMLKETGAHGASFSIMTTAEKLRASKVIRKQLNQAGFDVTIDQVTGATYGKRLVNWDYDTIVAGNSVDTDLSPALFPFLMPRDKGGGINFWGYHPSEELQELLRQQRQTLDREKRKEILWEIEDRLITDAGFAYTHHAKPWMAMATHVKGYKPHPVRRDFKNIWLEE